MLAPKLKDQNRWFDVKIDLILTQKGGPILFLNQWLFKQVVINTRRKKKHSWGLALIGISLDFSGASSINFSFFLPFSYTCWRFSSHGSFQLESSFALSGEWSCIGERTLKITGNLKYGGWFTWLGGYRSCGRVTPKNGMPPCPPMESVAFNLESYLCSAVGYKFYLLQKKYVEQNQ